MADVPAAQRPGRRPGGGRHRKFRQLPPPHSRRSLLLAGGALAAGGLADLVGGPFEAAPVPYAADRSPSGSLLDRERSAERASRGSARDDEPDDGRPHIYTRAEWGAKKAGRKPTIVNGAPRFIVVHHTWTDNVQDYSLKRAFRLSRGIQKWHRNNGWGDTGQHFTISRGGYIMEGRGGSLPTVGRGERVIGTHVSGNNDDTIGIECEGRYNDVLPPDDLLDALTETLVWLCREYELDPKEAIVPHMRFNDTDCAGYKFTPTLPGLAKDVARQV